MTSTTSAAYGGGHECPGRTRRCSVREHVPRAPSLGPPLGWAPPRAQSSPPRLAGSTDPVSAEELVTELRRALVDLHGSKSVSTFARDEFYIGPIYGVTGPKVRPSQRRRHRRCEGAIRRASASGVWESSFSLGLATLSSLCVHARCHHRIGCV